MDEEFGSFVVTDPDLVDEGIDVSGLRTKTDTSLLGNIPELAGVQYEAFNPTRLTDLMRFYQTGLPTRSVSQPTTPPATGGGGTGGGGQATTPITTPITTPTTGGGITNVDTPLTQMVTDPVTGQTQTVRQAMTSDAAYRGTTPSSPFLTSGAAGGASLANLDLNNIDLGNPTGDSRIVPEEQGLTGKPSMLGDTGGSMDQMSGVQQESLLQNILGQAGQTVSGALTQLGKIPGAIVDKVNQTVDIFGKKINVGKTLAAAAVNQKVGGPVSLIFQAAEELLPERDPRQTKLDELYDVKDGTIQSGLMKGYNPVSGNPLDPTFGLQDAYDKRIDTIENTLKSKYNMSDAEIADVKAGSYKGDVDTNLLDTLVDLEDAKKKEADVLGITAAEDKRQGEAEMRQTIADATRVNPFADIDTGVGEFDITPTTTPAATGVTRPGTGTVLGKPGIEGIEDYLDDEAFDEQFGTAPPGASTTGTPIDALNPVNRQQHFDNTEKLKDAVRAGEITPEEYNRLSAFDATKTMGLGPVTGTASAIGYQAVQTLAGDQNVSDFIGDTARNIQGVSGNITPEEQVKYQEIITGEKIYRDPILGMVEPPAPKTLAGDFGDAFSYLDDIDISQDTPTAPATTPIATDQIGTFDADTFDDEVGFGGPRTIEFDDSDFSDKDKNDIFQRERELENEYMKTTGEVPTPGRFMGQAFDEKVQEKIREQQTITPLEDDFESLVGPGADDDPAPAPTPTPTVPDFISGGGGGRDRDPDPAPSAPSFDPGQGFVDQGGGGEFGGAPPSKSSGPTYGPPSQSGGGGDGGGGGGCFLKGTQVTMADGSTKAIEQVDLGDKVAKGGKVFATGKFLVENLHDYKGIKVSGSHMVSEDGNWVRVEDSKHGKSLGDDEHTVYVFGSENRRILINGITFTDYFEVNEQDKLLNNEKDFFNNWKNYASKDSQNNVEIINAI